ncbi:hypothetical protein D3C72_2432890 [compost metagenome]
MLVVLLAMLVVLVVTWLLVSVSCEKFTASLGATPSATLVIVVPPVCVLLS